MNIDALLTDALSRVREQVPDVAGSDQVWTSDGWYRRFGLPFPPAAHGYGHSPADVAAVRVPSDLLAGYHDAVAEAALAYVGTLTPSSLDRVVDDSWDPPVTLGVRLVSVLNDVTQHVGQAAYVRGLLER